MPILVSSNPNLTKYLIDCFVLASALTLLTMTKNNANEKTNEKANEKADEKADEKANSTSHQTPYSTPH